MKKIIFIILGIFSTLMFFVMSISFVQEMLEYKKAVEDYNQTTSYAALSKSEITSKNMLEFGFASICYLGFVILSYKMAKKPKNGK